MDASIVPEPSSEEREAILAALAAAPGERPQAWLEAALAEGVSDDYP